ncbi:MAG TPA: response regulator [Dissulfurispiraceae bacterium]|nr:response regulator [Dissulfurispiraceae bacterium]
MNPEHRHGIILVVDDDPYVLEYVTSLLSEYNYSVLPFGNAKAAIDHVQKNGGINVVLTDIKMPGMTGIELLEHIHAMNPELPVLLMTAYAELDTAVSAIKQGAFDFIIKPYRSEQLIHSIEKAVRYSRLIQQEKEHKKILEQTVQERTKALSDALSKVKNMSRELIHRLTVVAEYRDTDTGLHNSRMGLFAKTLSEVMNLSVDFVDAITFASPLHDIGKVGISDGILLKPAPLTEEEFGIMKTHAQIGSNVLSGSTYPYIQMAASIAMHHHERWDGTGYPHRLKGEETPLEGRIVMICDQYDALRSKRPYKKPFTHDQAADILIKGDGRTMPHHFDPAVLAAFKKCSSVFDEIFDEQNEL